MNPIVGILSSLLQGAGKVGGNSASNASFKEIIQELMNVATEEDPG